MFNELMELHHDLERAWCDQTAVNPDLWTPQVPSTGQCAVTALLVQQKFGGEIFRADLRFASYKGSHYWNRINGVDYDLTLAQFGDEWVEPRMSYLVNPEVLGKNFNLSRRLVLLKERLERAAIARETPIRLDFAMLQKDCWQVAEDHGWHPVQPDGALFVEKLCLIHAEVSEALEEYRNGHDYTESYFKDGSAKLEGIPSELADIIIRTLDLAEMYGIDLTTAVTEKQNYNRTREFRHGGKKA